MAERYFRILWIPQYFRLATSFRISEQPHVVKEGGGPLCGARSQRQARLVRDLLEALLALPLDVPATDRAAAVHHALEQQGKTVGTADSLIAGIVLSHKAELLTVNRRHFERVEGLTLAELD